MVNDRPKSSAELATSWQPSASWSLHLEEIRYLDIVKKKNGMELPR